MGRRHRSNRNHNQPPLTARTIEVTAIIDDNECIHEGVECEFNTGEDACPCTCDECENPEIDWDE